MGKILAFRWGEFGLWILFLLSAAGASEGSREDLVLLAGVFALAAIGVRATRADRSQGNAR